MPTGLCHSERRSSYTVAYTHKQKNPTKVTYSDGLEGSVFLNTFVVNHVLSLCVLAHHTHIFFFIGCVFNLNSTTLLSFFLFHMEVYKILLGLWLGLFLQIQIQKVIFKLFLATEGGVAAAYPRDRG